MDEGGRPDGWTIQRMDGFERQNMVICQRWTSSTDTWTNPVFLGVQLGNEVFEILYFALIFANLG